MPTEAQWDAILTALMFAALPVFLAVVYLSDRWGRDAPADDYDDERRHQRR